MSLSFKLDLASAQRCCQTPDAVPAQPSSPRSRPHDTALANCGSPLRTFAHSPPCASDRSFDLGLGDDALPRPLSPDTLVDEFGFDSNCDCAVTFAIDAILGYEVECEDVMEAFSTLSALSDPTIQQLAEQVHMQVLGRRGDSLSAASAAQEARVPEQEQQQQRQQQASVLSGARSTPATPACIPRLKLGGMGNQKAGELAPGSTWDTDGLRLDLGSGAGGCQGVDPLGILRQLLPGYRRQRRAATLASVSALASLVSPRTGVHGSSEPGIQRSDVDVDVDRAAQHDQQQATPERAAAGRGGSGSKPRAGAASKPESAELGGLLDTRPLKDSSTVKYSRTPKDLSIWEMCEPMFASTEPKSPRSYCLPCDFWMEYAGGTVSDDEDSEASCSQVLLPEPMWGIIACLDATTGGSLGSHIRLQQQLAHTAYSVVYAAALDGAPVVVKKVDVSSEALLSKVFAEIAALEHLLGWDGAVQLLGYGRTGDEVSIVLQRCDMNARQWMQQLPLRQGQRDVVGLLRFFGEVASIVEQLHGRKLAHGDLKLENILLLDGRPVLSDLAEAVMFSAPGDAMISEARGTEIYQSPEMLVGKATSACAADVWALGCLLYELLMDEALFPGKGACLRPVLTQQRAQTSRPARWLSSPEKAGLRAAVGDKDLSAEIKQLLHCMLIEEDKRGDIARVAAAARQLLRTAEELLG